MTVGADAEQSWDPSTWQPTERITLTLISESEKEAAYREQMTRLAQADGTPQILDVQHQSWSATPEESARRVAACMHEGGFPVEVSPTGGLQYATPPESQQQAWNVAMNTCIAEHPVDPSFSQDWTEPQLRLIYDYWDQYLIPCLEAHGHPVDLSTRPTKQSFVSAFHTGQRHDWWPFAQAMRGVPEEEQARVSETCPELPPQDVFWGTSG